MAVQTATGQLTLEWDDGFVMIFSFAGVGSTGTQYCGFVHAVQSTALVTGSQTQTTPKVAQINQWQTQITMDPATWVETVKNGARTSAGAKVVYDDATTGSYTTVTNQSFTLQLLYSVSG